MLSPYFLRWQNAQTKPIRQAQSVFCSLRPLLLLSTVFICWLLGRVDTVDENPIPEHNPPPQNVVPRHSQTKPPETCPVLVMPTPLDVRDPKFEDAIMEIVSNKELERQTGEFRTYVRPFEPSVYLESYPPGYVLPKFDLFDGSSDPIEHLAKWNFRHNALIPSKIPSFLWDNSGVPSPRLLSLGLVD